MAMPDRTTIERLSERRTAGLRALAVELGFPPSFAGRLSAVLCGRDDVSRETENDIRRALGLPPLPQMVTVPACASCGSVHTGDCGGREVAAVAVLAAGERIAPAGAQIVRRRPPQRWRDMTTREVARAIRERKPYGG